MKIHSSIIICMILMSSCSSIKKAPDGFGFIFKSNWTTLNTFDKTVKTRVRSENVRYRDTTISLVLSKAQMDTVFTIMEAIQISSYPENYLPDDRIIPISPNIAHSYELFYSFENREKRIVWKTYSHTEMGNKSIQLNKLIFTIDYMIWNHPEFKKLPIYIAFYM